jgi:hypothetical protein
MSKRLLPGKWRDAIILITARGVNTMFKPQRLTFDELSERLRGYERKYGYKSFPIH